MIKTHHTTSFTWKRKGENRSSEITGKQKFCVRKFKSSQTNEIYHSDPNPIAHLSISNFYPIQSNYSSGLSLSLYLFHRLKYVKLGEFVFYFFWAFFFNVNFWFMNEIVLILGSFVADVVISVKVIGCMEASFMFSFYFVFSGMSLISMGLYFWLIFWFFLVIG